MMLLLIICCVYSTAHALEDYTSYFTTSVIQKFQVPTTIVQQINRTNPEYVNPAVLKYDNVYVKQKISRIIGKARIEESILNRSIKTFEVPVKFLLPVFAKRGAVLDSYRSRVISMHVENEKIEELADQEVLDIEHIVRDTRIYDMNSGNLRRSITGKLVMVDTEILVDDLPNDASLLFAFNNLNRYKKSLDIEDYIAQRENIITTELMAGTI